VAAAVRRQTARRRKPFLTDVALERFLSAVRLDVYAVMFRPSERLPAEQTLMWLDAGVDHAVPFEVSKPREALIADAAFERSVGRMVADMQLQRTAALVALSTFRTLVLRLYNIRIFLRIR